MVYDIPVSFIIYWSTHIFIVLDINLLFLSMVFMYYIPGLPSQVSSELIIPFRLSLIHTFLDIGYVGYFIVILKATS